MNRLVLLAIPLVTLACSSAEPGRMADVPDAVVVAVSAPASGTAGATFPATVVSRRTAEIATRMSGTVERVSVDVGDAVRAGDPLVDIDAGDVTARVRAAEADLAMTRRTHGRIERLAGAGAASASELDAAVAALDWQQVAVLHCTSEYPCPPEHVNLRMIPRLQAQYLGRPVGYSGHEIGIPESCGAVVLGACIVERHFTLSRAAWGSDHAASLEPGGFAKLVQYIRTLEAAMGDGIKRVYPGETKNAGKFRKTVVVPT